MRRLPSEIRSASSSASPAAAATSSAARAGQICISRVRWSVSRAALTQSKPSNTIASFPLVVLMFSIRNTFSCCRRPSSRASSRSRLNRSVSADSSNTCTSTGTSEPLARCNRP